MFKSNVKAALCILFTLFIHSSVHAEVLRLSEPLEQDANSETFGIKLNPTLPVLSMANLAANSESHLGTPFQTEARIAKVCQKKGCFFIAQQDQHILRVSFRDYGFFIPTDSSGKTVILTGELVKKDLSPEQAAHFKSDLNSDSEAVKAGVVYEIVADSVKIPRA